MPLSKHTKLYKLPKCVMSKCKQWKLWNNKRITITYLVSSRPYIEICRFVKSMEGEAEPSLPYILQT